MTKTRREFTPEFKREAVALLESSGRPLMQIATELGISPSMCATGGLVMGLRQLPRK
jgi:transposase